MQPGAVFSLSVVTFEVANSGNVHLNPAGEFVLRNEAGDELATAVVAFDSVYARSSTLLEVPLASPLRPGTYCAELRLADASTGARDATDCLPLSVAAPGATDAGSGSPTIPILEPIVDAAGHRCSSASCSRPWS